MARIAQVGMCAADLPRTVRRFVEVFGFQDAGGRMIWGGRLAKIQDLGEDMSGCLWWLVGGQEFINLELFHHSSPSQRPLPPDWLPNSVGWVRWGFAVADLDTVAGRLEESAISSSGIVTVGGLRRVCFRDPDIGVVVEVIEESTGLARPRQADTAGSFPRSVYVSLSVLDLAAARSFYADVLGFQPVARQLHPPEMEALWGLPGAERDVLLLDGGSMFLEVVQYRDPPGRRRSDARLSDQGIMNIAVGYRERPALEEALERAVAGGCTVNAPLGDQPAVATYVKDPLGNSLEMLCAPKELEEALGWVARPPSFR